MCNAFDKTLTGIIRVSCWNHIINSAKLWLKRHGARSDEIPIYVSNFRDLLHEPTCNAYLRKLEMLKANWSKAFLDYYNIDVDVQYLLI